MAAFSSCIDHLTAGDFDKITTAADAVEAESGRRAVTPEQQTKLYIKAVTQLITEEKSKVDALMAEARNNALAEQRQMAPVEPEPEVQEPAPVADRAATQQTWETTYEEDTGVKWADLTEAEMAQLDQAELDGTMSDVAVEVETSRMGGLSDPIAVNPDLAGEAQLTRNSFTSGEDAATWLATTDGRLWIKQTMAAIAPLLKNTTVYVLRAGDLIGNVMPSVPLDVQTSIHHGFNTLGHAAMSAALPDGSNITVLLEGSAGFTNTGLAHELVHNATTRAINAGDARFSSIAKRFRVALRNGEPGVAYSAADKNTLEFFESVVDSPKEFVAYALTSDALQTLMRRMGADGRWFRDFRSTADEQKITRAQPKRVGVPDVPRYSLWQRFVDAILSVLKLPTRYKAEYESLLATRDRAVANNAQASKVEFVPLKEEIDRLLSEFISDQQNRAPGGTTGASQPVQITPIKARVGGTPGSATRVSSGPTTAGVARSTVKPVTLQSVVRDVPTVATELMDYLKMGRDAVAIRGMFTEDLVNLAAKVIPAAKGYLSAMKAIQAKRGAAERTVESVLNQFRALSSSEQGTGPSSVNAFIKESTFDGKWAFMPDWLPKGSVEVDADLAQRFDEMLSKPAQAAVKAVFKHGYTSLQEMKKAALAMHSSEYDGMIAEATKAGDTKEVAKLERKKAKSMKEFQSLFAIHEFKPYAPLKRFGNYAVLATSARYKAAHEAGDTKTMQELQSDGAHYHVEFAETPWAAKKLVAMLTPKFPEGFVGKMEKSDDSMMMGGRDTLAAFGRLRKSIKENTDDELMGIDRKTAARMDDMMRQMYLTLLSEASARKSEIHRKNISGADGDMMRAFATQGRATAHFIAGLQTSGQVDDHIASMREQTRKLDSGPQREERQKYLNEIMRRHSMGLEYHPSPIIDKLMSSSSVMMLLTNPAYHVMNALQPGLMTQPLLAARHGYFKSWNELRRAYTDLGPILKSAKFDEASYAKLPQDVRQAISDLADKGVIDIMMDADLGRFESVPDSALRGVSIVTEKLRHIAQNVEAMNRLSSAIAAYRLEKTKGNATHQSAVDYAAKVIYESHGDYSGFNAPRFMRNDIGRVLTQFRKFQLIQLSLVTREFHRAFFGESAEVKTAGRYALAYTLSHLLATAGVMGLPGVAAIGWALGKLTPDDEPDDPEATLRRLIGNKQAADLLIKGAPKAFGVDLSRTGAGNMLSLFPYADIDISREGYPKLLMAATGPFFGGLLPRMAEGLTQVSRGNVTKGAEGFMPNGMSNVLRSARFASEGITKANGDVTLSSDELGALDVMAQAFGLPTNKVTDKNFLSSSQYNAEQFYKDKSSELKQRYTKAAKTNDADTMRSLREEWMRVQTTSKEVGITPQPLQNLLKAPIEQRKREQDTQYGVAYTKKTAGYAPALME